MKLTFLVTCFASLVSATEPLIVGFGSSYAVGLGLDKPLGQVLSDRLNKTSGVQHKFLNLAESGAKLLQVAKTQARKAMGQKPALIYMMAGGADLDYVSCIADPMSDYCYLPIHYEEFKYRYMAALDALVAVARHDSHVPIYLITYPEAIGADTNCKRTNNNCRFSKKQFGMVTAIYKTLLDYTVRSIHDWRLVGSNIRYNVKIVPLHIFSKDHHVTSLQPWIRSPGVRMDGDGIMWHPTKACVDAMADDICKDLNGDGTLL